MQIVDSAVPTQMYPVLTIQQPIQQRAETDTGMTQPTPRLLRDLIGAEVFYVLSDGQRRPAVVVRDWGNNMVNLQVFTDGENDFAPGDPGSDGPLWVTSVHYAPAVSRAPGTWHWRTEVF